MAGLAANLKAVQEHLDQGEKIYAAVYGAYEAKVMGASSLRNGVFIATDKRLIFFGKKLFGYDMEVFPFANISSFEQGKGAMGHKIAFFASGNKVSMKWISQGDFKKFVEYMHYIIGNKGGIQQPTPDIQMNATQPTFAQPGFSSTQSIISNDEKPKWFDSKPLVILLIFVFFPVGLYALWKNSYFSKKLKIILTILVGAVVLMIGASGEDSPSNSTTAKANSTPQKGSEERAEKYIASPEMKQLVIDFEHKLTSYEKPALLKINQFSEAASKIGTKYTVYDLYSYAEDAQRTCNVVWEKYSELSQQVPTGLPKDIKKMLVEAAENMKLAYFTKNEAFKYAKSFLDDQKPSNMQKYKNELESSQSYVFSAVAKLTQVKIELGMMDTKQ